MIDRAPLDELDISLLEALQRNARSTYAELGALVGLKAPSVHDRVKRLEARGFIRRYSFAAHRSAHLIALWEKVEDAQRFAASPGHREASRALFAGRWQYSHFAALWELRSNRGRIFFCPECHGTTPAPADACRSCGTPLVDVYHLPASA